MKRIMVASKFFLNGNAMAFLEKRADGRFFVCGSSKGINGWHQGPQIEIEPLTAKNIPGSTPSWLAPFSVEELERLVEDAWKQAAVKCSWFHGLV